MLHIITDKIRLFFRKDKESYLHFYHILGFYPHHLEYYKQALLHKSYSIKEAKGTLPNNERLEFLGDAVIESIITDILYQHFKNENEGFLTCARAKIVKRETLNRIGREIGLDKLIKSGISIDTHNSYLCGNAFEALVGAIYLDRGYKYCYRFISNKILRQYIDLQQIVYTEENYKSKLLEWAQQNQVDVSFELLEQNKDEHNNQIFLSLVTLQGLPCSQGSGYSKKESHQKAAQKALKKLKKEELFRRAVIDKVTKDKEVQMSKDHEIFTSYPANEDLQSDTSYPLNKDIL